MLKKYVIIQFEDGTYAVRAGRIFHGFVDRYSHHVWHQEEPISKYCRVKRR